MTQESNTPGSSSASPNDAPSSPLDGQGSLFTMTSERSEAIPLLPTPTAADGTKMARNKTSGRKEGSNHHSGTTLQDVAYEWATGTSSPPSMPSSAASPARALPTPARAMVSTILRLLCGPSSRESFASFDPDTSGSKTWRQSALSILEPSGEPFSGTWPRWGMTWRGDAFELPTWEPRTDAIASSPLLGTPTAHERTHTPRPVHHGRQLANDLALLPTPRTSDQNGPGVHGTGGMDLRTQVHLLSTPAARDWKDTGAPSEFDRKSPQLLPTVLPLLPTPRAERAGRTVQAYPGTVSGASHARQADGGHGDLEESMGRLLAVKLLPTPVAGDGREKGGGGRWNPNSAPLEQTIKDETLPSSGGFTSPPSDAGSTSTEPRPRLSPEFVGWMMGTPSCTDCGREWTDSACPHSATEFTST